MAVQFSYAALYQSVREIDLNMLGARGSWRASLDCKSSTLIVEKFRILLLPQLVGKSAGIADTVLKTVGSVMSWILFD